MICPRLKGSAESLPRSTSPEPPELPSYLVHCQADESPKGTAILGKVPGVGKFNGPKKNSTASDGWHRLRKRPAVAKCFVLNPPCSANSTNAFGPTIANPMSEPKRLLLHGGTTWQRERNSYRPRSSKRSKHSQGRAYRLPKHSVRLRSFRRGRSKNSGDQIKTYQVGQETSKRQEGGKEAAAESHNAAQVTFRAVTRSFFFWLSGPPSRES